MAESRSKSKKLVRRLFGYLAGLVFLAILLRPPDFQTKQAVNSNIHSSNDPESFVEKWCNLQGAEWYPGGWQERTPYFLLAGAKKSGTTSLFKYLSTHPNLVTPRIKELLFFLPNNFQFLDQENKTLVEDTRRYMYEHDYKTQRIQQDEMLLSFEATPGYLFHSTTSSKSILCTCPWVKILLILRNPIDRAWSNYNFYISNHVRLPAFETWVKQDLRLLKNSGVLNNEKNFAGSTAEYEAWDTYLKLAKEGPIGRSMYAIQLEHWYDAMKAIGRDPTKEIFIVRSEDLKRDLQNTMDRIFTWLELPKQKYPPMAKEFMVSKYERGEMADETRVMLEEFFQPYNQRLYDMLGGDWQRVWDQPKNYSALDEENTVVQEVQAKEKSPNKDAENKNLMQVLNSPTATASSVYGIPTYNATIAASFVDKWCEMRNVKEWYPTGEDSWRLRAPYFMLPGVRKSGTTSLANYIMQHPKAARARTKELQFFLNKNFRQKYVRDSDRKTLVKEARLGYEREFRRTQLEDDPSLFSMDATPGYVFFSTILPQRILCVCPWIKVLIIMRNPVDQVYSNYAFTKRITGTKVTFEKWIAEDFKALEEAGFIAKDGKSLSREQEDEAWTKYLKFTTAGQIGRSLYEIQLRHWFQAMRDIGRDPETQIHIVRNEDMKNDLDGVYRKILDFLGLPYHPLKSTEAKVVSNYTSLGLNMSNKTREMLETFFAPYNKRLYNMLGGDWDGYWDPPATS